MKILAATLLPLFAASVASAQNDSIRLANGKVVDGVTVQSFTIREIKYAKSGNVETTPSDQVISVTLARFKDVFKRGLADRDPDLFVTETRNQIDTQKNPLLAQFGYVEAARLFFSGDKDGSGVAALEEMQQKIPDAGLLPELYRMKFEAYVGRGDATGNQNALTVAKKYASDATTNAWPAGFALEAEMFTALAEGAASSDLKTFQSKMRDIAGRAAAVLPVLAGRANVQLAHSLRQGGDIAAADKIYQDVLEHGGDDDNSRAGAHLGLGLLAMAKGDAANREPFRVALLSFLRVRLETKTAWESLQAEALYHAMLAAEKWGGQDYRLIQGRCRNQLLNNFSGSEWAARAREK